MTGSASGRLVAAERIDPEALAALREDVVLLVRRADGDEEVAAGRGHVKGVVLCHELPHLSHLGEARGEAVTTAALQTLTLLVFRGVSLM